MLSIGLSIGRTYNAPNTNTSFNPALMVLNTNKSLDVSSQDTIPMGLTFNDDGSQIFMIGAISDSVNPYDNVSYDDISAAIYTMDHAVLLGSPAANPTDIVLLNSGTKMLTTHIQNQSVNTYTLSAAYDPSSISYQSGQSINVSTQETVPRSAAITQDGAIMIVGGDSNTIYAYDLSIANNPGSATYNASKSLDISSFCGRIESAKFINNDTAILVTDSVNEMIHHIQLGTSGVPSSGAYKNNMSLDVSAIDNEPKGAFFDPTGQYMYMIGGQHDTIYLFTL